jgi:magnesium chelatase family protein
MLAHRLASLLPPLTEDEALQSAALLSLQRTASEEDLDARFGHRPIRSPHHSASAMALVGGGSPPQPGEISLAHAGVLFLDELPEFPRKALEALREPLETGHITLSRAGHQAQYPAQFQWVAAMNPCPCGWLGAYAATGKTCRCTPDLIARYQGRLSGPLLDRLDLLVEVPAVAHAALLAAPDGEPSAIVAQRVARARSRMVERQGRPNAMLDPAQHHTLSDLQAATRQCLERAAQQWGWSGRTLHRVIKVAWTIADLAGEPTPAVAHVAEAMQYRRSLESVSA